LADNHLVPFCGPEDATMPRYDHLDPAQRRAENPSQDFEAIPPSGPLERSKR
jgi:hypothetical protein